MRPAASNTFPRRWTGFLRTLALGAVGVISASTALSQPAPTALDAFQSICMAEADHTSTVAAFERTGWSQPSAQFEQYLTQDLLDPDDAALFSLDAGGVPIFAAAMSEKRGLLGNRSRTLCFVRLFTDDPTLIRADFRGRIGTDPDEVTDSDEVRADTWLTFLEGRVFGLRAVKLGDGFWMVTLNRMRADG